MPFSLNDRIYTELIHFDILQNTIVHVGRLSRPYVCFFRDILCIISLNSDKFSIHLLCSTNNSIFFSCVFRIILDCYDCFAFIFSSLPDSIQVISLRQFSFLFVYKGNTLLSDLVLFDILLWQSGWSLLRSVSFEVLTQLRENLLCYDYFIGSFIMFWIFHA